MNKYCYPDLKGFLLFALLGDIRPETNTTRASDITNKYRRTKIPNPGQAKSIKDRR